MHSSPPRSLGTWAAHALLEFLGGLSPPPSLVSQPSSSMKCPPKEKRESVHFAAAKEGKEANE